MEASAMKKALVELGTLFGKVNIELGFAKKEMAYGKLGPEDFSDISLLLRNIMLPIFGMTTFIDIIQFIKKKLSAKRLLGSSDTIEVVGKLEIEEWDEIMAPSYALFQKMDRAIQDGMKHISYVL
jgi:Putative ER transporter, 6TM, N-terminal